MNITELTPGNRVLIEWSSSCKEVVKIRAISSDGFVTVRNNNGEELSVRPQTIVKIFS